MSARKELAGILEQWLQLTRVEGAAIQAALWPAVRRIQARKAALRKSLIEAARTCAEADAAAGPATRPRAFLHRGGPDHFFAHAQRRGADRPIAPGAGAAGIARPGGTGICGKSSVRMSVRNHPRHGIPIPDGRAASETVLD